MADKKKEHIIEHQIVNLEIEGTDDEIEINQIQQNFVYFYKEHIGKELNRVFDKLAPSDVNIQIDELNLNLGNFSYVEPSDLEKAIIKKIKKIIPKEVKKKIKTMQKKASTNKDRKQKFSKMGILEFFLQNGFYPNWASSDNGTISQIFDDLAGKNPKVLIQRIFQLRKDARVRERLYQQFSVNQLNQFFKLLYGTNAQIAFKQIRVLKKKLGQQSEKAIISAAINYVFEGSSALGTIEYKERAFIRRVVEEVQQRTMTTNVKTKVRAGFEGTYQDVQVLEYFLDYGAIPSWADVDSKKSLQDLFHNLLEHQLVGLQRMLERNAHKSNFVQRLIFQFPTDKILGLIEPTPTENLQFIKDSIKDFEFLTRSRQNINQTISSSNIRTIILKEVIDYFFVLNKSKFIKKTFIKSVVEQLARATQTSYNTLVKESYKSVRRKKNETVIRPALEQLDDSLQSTLNKERKELRKAKKDFQAFEKQLINLTKKQTTGTISAQELGQLRSLSKQLKQLEEVIEELDDVDMPLEIELVLRQRQDLKQQIKIANDQERNKLEKRLNLTDKEYNKLQGSLNKEVQNLLENKKKLKTKVGTIAEQRIKRINNRIGKYHRAIQSIVQQLRIDQKDIELFLANINKSLRTDISNEEKQRLRQERSRLQKELIKINEYIDELNVHSEALEETLRTTLSAVETKDDNGLEATRTSKLDALIFTLQYGSTPWWAEQFPRQTIEELLLEFSKEAPDKLRNALQQVGKYPVVWQRIINQLSESGIQSLLKQLHPSHTTTIFAQADLLFTIHYSQGFERLKNTEQKKFKWGIILEYILSNRQNFNAQDFNKEVMLQTARLYMLSPSKLIEYSNNIIKNSEDDLTPFREWNEQLAKDAAVSLLERELIRFQQETQEKEEGVYLNDEQKLELLAEYMSTGQITTRAKELNYNRQERFEELLLEQIQKKPKATKHVVFNLLRLSNTRNLIIHNFSENLFWEIVHLVRPRSLLLVQRHFKDFKNITGDSKLELEKDVLFNFFLSQQQETFDTNEYIKSIFLAKQKVSGRKLLALLSETKRQIKAMGTASQSSWLISVLIIEVEALKYEEKQTKDMDLRANLNEQISSTAKEYTDTSTQMIDILSEETAEAQGLPDKMYKLDELDTLIIKHQTELEKLKKSRTEDDALATLENKRKIALYEAQIKFLKLSRPPLLRKVERDIVDVTTRLNLIEKQLQEELAKNIKTEDLAEEIAIEQSLMERQIEIEEQLKKEDPNALKLLPILLKDLIDTGLNQDSFVSILQSIVQELQGADYRSELVAFLAKKATNSVDLEKLKGSTNLNQQQALLLDKIDQIAPFQLWKEWETLEAYFKKNPNELTTERAVLQQKIYTLINRKDQQNLLGYAGLMATTRERLEKELQQATSLEDLAEVQEQIDVLWEQQKYQVDEMLEIAINNEIKGDLQQLKTNLDAHFTKIQNRRIKRSNDLVTIDQKRLKEEKIAQELRIKELKQQKDFILDEIKKKESPPKPQPAKKKRKPKVPIPAPVEEPLQVYNAGMVLLWPYIGRLFNILGYTVDKQFVDIDAQYKAIHILQYLVTGKTEAPENELLLNKIFCNFPITEPVPFGIEFTPDELKIAEGLLVGVIKNWSRMKSMTPNSLRGSFLIREGTIKQEDDKWLLTVKKQTFDILLKTIPWGFTLVRFPWAEKFISVEWKLM